MNGKTIICSGALVYARSTKRFLLLYRTQGRAKDVWGLVGGTTEDTETPWEGLQREIFEEIGEIEIKKTIPLETFISNDDKFHFHTYLCVVDEEFIPILNDEHNGYAWTTFKSWPKPLHNGAHITLNKNGGTDKLTTILSIQSA